MTRWAQTLWQQPRRSGARRVLFQVHLWLGVLLGLYTVVVGVTGSALVFRPETEAMQRPELFRHAAAQAGGPQFSLTRVFTDVRSRYPGEQVLGIDDLDRPQDSAVVYLDTAAHQQRQVYVDQQTGALLGDKLRYAGLLGTCANLHVYLLGGSIGYLVNGFCALAFLLLTLTGWLLWWPGAGKVGRGLRVHWRARWKRLNWDLHAVGGFWSNPLLILVIATGILFVFPRPVLTLLSIASGGSRQAVASWLEPPTVVSKAGKLVETVPVISADAALTMAQHQLPSGYAVRYLALPAEQAPAEQANDGLYDAIAYPRGGADYAMPVYIYVPEHAVIAATGTLVQDARRLPPGMRWATYAYAVHFGTFGGTASRVVWVLLGLMPAALWTTGLLLWWHRSLRPRLLAMRQAGR